MDEKEVEVTVNAEVDIEGLKEALYACNTETVQAMDRQMEGWAGVLTGGVTYKVGDPKSPMHAIQAVADALNRLADQRERDDPRIDDNIPIFTTADGREMGIRRDIIGGYMAANPELPGQVPTTLLDRRGQPLCGVRESIDDVLEKVWPAVR